MAVASSVTLPAQPTDGTMTLVPLGGDGFTAPHSAYAIQNHRVDGASGGGAAVLTVIMDDRYCSLVQFVTIRNDQVASADADLRLIITAKSGGTQIPQQTLSGPISAISATVNPSTIGVTWNPTPILLPGGSNAGQLVASMLNVENDEYRLSTMIYLFDISVRERTPMGQLLWSRGAT